jgi:hypothetical protein
MGERGVSLNYFYTVQVLHGRKRFSIVTQMTLTLHLLTPSSQRFRKIPAARVVSSDDHIRVSKTSYVTTKARRRYLL